MEVARKAEVEKELIVYHLSSRYRGELTAVAREIEGMGLPFKVRLIPPGELVEIE